MNMKLTFWLIAASLGLVSAGLVDPTQRYFFGYGDVLSRKWSKEGPKFCWNLKCLFLSSPIACVACEQTELLKTKIRPVFFPSKLLSIQIIIFGWHG